MSITTFDLGNGEFDMSEDDMKRVCERMIKMLKEELPEEALNVLNIEYFFDRSENIVRRIPIVKLNAL